jgi:hypothetical protein
MIDSHGPALCNDDGWPPHWVPFVEDLRSDPSQHRHALCFAQAKGTGALVDAVTAWQTANRTELFQLRSRLDSLQGSV